MTKPGPRIRQMLLDGASNRAIVEALTVSSATVSYHARRLGLAKTARPTYDWPAIGALIAGGVSVRECQRRFGFAKASCEKAIARGAVTDTRILIQRMSAAQYSAACDGRRATPSVRATLRRKLVREGRPERCEHLGCGIEVWHGKRAPLEIDHIDGDATNNKLSNIRLLCLNCHSQTPTFRGRNTLTQRLKRAA